MLPDLIKESNMWGVSLAAALFVVALVVAFGTRLVINVLTKRIRSRNSGSLSIILLEGVRNPVLAFILSLGILSGYLVLSNINTELFRPLDGNFDVGIIVWKVVAIIIFTVTVGSIGDKAIGWYLVNIAHKTDSQLDDTLLPTLRRIFPITVYATGFLVAIDAVGISISPILAGLCIGGLAVALAVQPTLSNFFAGTYVVTEGELNEGDFIELEGGPSGYVEDVGWRSTKIRSRFNNLVIIPNSKMAESIVTNFFSPTPAMNVLVTCGVSYESDLGMVEQIALEEANILLKESDDAIKDVTPFFGFSNFGDSNIDFFVFMQAVDRIGTFRLKSTLIKRIHTRFVSEGIEINYPVRKLVVSGSEDEVEFPNVSEEDLGTSGNEADSEQG